MCKNWALTPITRLNDQEQYKSFSTKIARILVAGEQPMVLI